MITNNDAEIPRKDGRRECLDSPCHVTIGTFGLLLAASFYIFPIATQIIIKQPSGPPIVQSQVSKASFPAPSRTREAFLKRAQEAIARMANEMSEEALAMSLSASSDIGALAKAISNPLLSDPALELDPLAPARARALEHRKELARTAGQMLTAGQVSELLGISRQALDKRRKAASLLGVRVGGDWRYPVVQFHGTSPLPRLKEVLKAHHGVDGWVILDSILAKNTAYGNKSLLDLLVENDEEMLERAILEIEDQYAP